MNSLRSEDVAPLPVLLAQPALALSIVSHLPEGLLLIDMRTDGFPIVYCNSAFFDITGCLMDEIMGMPCLDCLRELADDELAGYLLLHFRTERPGETEFISRCKRGGIRRCELSLTPVYGNMGQASHMLLLIRPCTSWKDN